MQGKEHAVVIGSSVAGLLAARVLSDFFTVITIVERDARSSAAVPRSGVPQGRQTHVLLPGGTQVIERLFPGRLEDLIRRGAQKFDYGRSRFHLDGHWMPRVKTELFSMAQTRPFLELHLNEWVSAIPNIRLIHGTGVRGLLLSRNNERVAGVRVSNSGVGGEREIRADLVVDSSGRNSRLPEWLNKAGYGRVPETKINIDVGYTTATFRAPREILPDHPLMYIVGRPPEKTRVGALIQVEDGLLCAGMAGYHGDYPPADLRGFLAFARSLCEPDVHEVLAQAELVSQLAHFRVPVSTRRHYSSLRRFPAGILPIGDAISSFDPVFAQGMTAAALAVEILADCLRRHVEPNKSFSREYLKRVESMVDIPWGLCCGENFKYPQTRGRRPLLYWFTRRYKELLLASEDPIVLRELYKVLTLCAPPQILLRKDVVRRALGISRPQLIRSVGSAAP